MSAHFVRFYDDANFIVEEIWRFIAPTMCTPAEEWSPCFAPETNQQLQSGLSSYGMNLPANSCFRFLAAIRCTGSRERRMPRRSARFAIITGVCCRPSAIAKPGAMTERTASSQVFRRTQSRSRAAQGNRACTALS
ncbi:MAG TPA: hypothetical protein VGE12_22290 [Noviherbaspirillum sp.]